VDKHRRQAVRMRMLWIPLLMTGEVAAIRMDRKLRAFLGTAAGLPHLGVASQAVLW